MDLYAFGSFCRGDLDEYSDIDILAVDCNKQLSRDKSISIYSSDRLMDLWREGNPFAWHLFYESKLLYTDLNRPVIESLGIPEKYMRAQLDMDKFWNLFLKAKGEITKGTKSLIFECSNIFLSIRNFATCYSFEIDSRPVFSRDSYRRLGEKSLQIKSDFENILLMARIISTRGEGDFDYDGFKDLHSIEFDKIESWMFTLKKDLEGGRI